MSLTVRAKVIRLRPKNPAPNIAAMSARPRDITLLSQTAHAWIGRPVSNPKCPALFWPKFAWEAIPPRKASHV